MLVNKVKLIIIILLVGCFLTGCIFNSEVDLEKAKKVTETVVLNFYTLEKLEDLDKNLEEVRKYTSPFLAKDRFSIVDPHEIDPEKYFRMPVSTSSAKIIKSVAEYDSNKKLYTVITAFEYVEFSPDGVAYTYDMFVVTEVNNNFKVIEFDEYITNIY